MSIRCFMLYLDFFAKAVEIDKLLGRGEMCVLDKELRICHYFPFALTPPIDFSPSRIEKKKLFSHQSCSECSVTRKKWKRTERDKEKGTAQKRTTNWTRVVRSSNLRICPTPSIYNFHLRFNMVILSALYNDDRKAMFYFSFRCVAFNRRRDTFFYVHNRMAHRSSSSNDEKRRNECCTSCRRYI